MNEDKNSRKRRQYAELAVELHKLAEHPRNQGMKWTWITIGTALGINAANAQRLVQWMRKHYIEMYWTVGIYETRDQHGNYQTEATNQARVALDGMLNQQRHLVTRLETMKQGCETLARLDPDPDWKHLMELNAMHFTGMLGSETVFQELLIQRANALGWQPKEYEEV